MSTDLPTKTFLLTAEEGRKDGWMDGSTVQTKKKIRQRSRITPFWIFLLVLASTTPFKNLCGYCILGDDVKVKAVVLHTFNSAASMNNRDQRIAVIGSGISGLTAAYLLSQKGHNVTLFEREKEIGMDAHGVSGICGDSNDVRVDVPLRVFSRAYYPNLVKMLKHIGMQIIDADYSFSCSGFARGEKSGEEETQPDTPLFGYKRFGWFVTPDWSAFLPGFAAAFDSAHLLAQLVCLLVRAESYLRSGDAAGKTLGEFLSSRGFSERFKAALFYPMFSIVCTCSYSSVDKYPASVALEYFARHGVLNWPWAKTCQCRVRGGVRCIAQTLAKHVPRVHLGVKIRGVFTATKAQVDTNSRTTKDSATPGKPVVAYEVAPSDGDDSDPQRQRHVWEAFDHVIVATQAHQALELLLSPPQDQLETEPVKHNMTADDRVEQIPRLDAYKNALGHFKYERSRVVVHCDPRLMPSSRRQWAPLNILVPGVSAPASTANASAMPMCSVWMTRIDDRVSPNVYQTWNPIIEPQGTTFADGHFDRPVMSLGTLKCLAELDELQGECGIHFVGAYALHAVPLLESGVRSAMRAVTRVDANCQIPWEGSDSSSLVPGKKEANDLSKTVAIGSFPWSMKVILGIAAAGFAYAQTQALRQK